ncbi:MAG: NTP transferase domain-containing protein [Clostridiales bacterium]|nr:NTP transferase domain-containing protein [Clostridiales bacterium]
MKAVIMAGGEGTRLRPLTCTLPKPMARLCGRPVLEYILDLLCGAGINEAVITLKYLPDAVISYFDSAPREGMKLEFVVENEPMGTAGGVKNALKDANEDFLVISGDALCDYDLKKAVQFHKSTNADATIVCARADDPREYGLVSANDDGTVTGFIEKPAWAQVTTDCANTGIYIFKPSVLSLIPDEKASDFAKDIFPHMLEKGGKLVAYRAEGYWCDIGDLASYRKCQSDILNGRVRCSLKPVAQGVFTGAKLPSGSYTLVPPVYIGRNVQIESGAVIGPDSVVDDGSLVGRGATVRRSVMLQNSFVSASAKLNEAILCCSASVKRGGQIYEGGVLGQGSVLGTDAVLRQNVLVWPDKKIDSLSSVTENIKFGEGVSASISESEITGEYGVELTPEKCVCLGAAIGSCEFGKRVGISTDGEKTSKVMKLAITAGLMYSGSHVWDFGECFEAQNSFFTSFCGLETGIFISGTQGGASVRLCTNGGLSLPRSAEREIDSRLKRGEFNRCTGDDCRDISDMRSVYMIYKRELCNQATGELYGMSARIESPVEEIKDIVSSALALLGAKDSPQLLFRINSKGTRLSAEYTATGEHIPFEKLLAICCDYELKNGRDVALPCDAPQMISSLATGYGKRAIRYAGTPADTAENEARKLGARQIWSRDALFMCVKLMSIMKDTGKSLHELQDELPGFYIARKYVDIDVSPARISDALKKENSDVSHSEEGVLFNNGNGKILVTPLKNGRALRIIAEAVDSETAQELCALTERQIRLAALDIADNKE